MISTNQLGVSIALEAGAFIYKVKLLETLNIYAV
jgi:hypothetical protein